MEVRRRTPKQNNYYWGTLVSLITDKLISLGQEVDKNIVHLYLKNRFIPMVAQAYNIDESYFISRGKFSTRNMNVHHWDTYKILIQEFAATVLSLQIPDPNERQEDY